MSRSLASFSLFVRFSVWEMRSVGLGVAEMDSVSVVGDECLFKRWVCRTSCVELVVEVLLGDGG